MIPSTAFFLALCLAPAPVPSPTPAPTEPAPAAQPAPASGPGDTSPAGAPAPDGTPAPAAEESDDSVTKYQFTGLDIEGELRTPALLQFLARIGGEFETVGIPHRSFMPELQATVMEDAL